MSIPKTPRPSIVHGESHAYPVLARFRDIVVFSPHMIVPLFVRPREVDPRGARRGHEERRPDHGFATQKNRVGR